MKDWRGLVRKVIGEPRSASSTYSDLALRLPRLFVLRPQEGLGKDFLVELEQFSDKVSSCPDDQTAEEISRQIFQTAEEFSKTQSAHLDSMITEITASTEELLQKLGSYVEIQSDRIGEIEKVRTNISAAQSAATLDGMRDLLTVSLGGLQQIVEAELQRQNDLRSDHENYANRLKVKLATVEKESRTDVLTGIANRSGCMKRMDAVIDYVKTNRTEYRLILIDLNGFKQINDTLGHGAGDAALVAFSQRLSKAFSKDHFVGRLAGDEFVVISSASAAMLNSLMFRLQEQFETLPATYKGMRLEISFCYGMSTIARDSDTSSVLEQADIMLYKHKNDFYTEKVA